MKMLMLIEKVIILRSLNYLRISQPDLVGYNLIYPLTFSLMTILILILVNDYVPLNISSIVDLTSPILITLTPFYVAALAAVATFKGNKKFDEPMDGNTPTLVIRVGGKNKEIDLSLRYFLSLLFGYCSVLSFFLFLTSIIFRYVLEGLVEPCLLETKLI